MFVDYLDNIDELENNNEVKKNINIIEQIYKFMSFVNFLSFESTSLGNSDMNWNYKGDGVVKINVIRNKIADIIDEEWTDKSEIYMDETIELNDDGKIIKLNDRKLWKFFNDKVEFWRYRNGDFENIFSFIEKDNKIFLLNNYTCSLDIYSGLLNLLDDRLIFSIFINNMSTDIAEIGDNSIENNEEKMIQIAHRKKEKIVYTYYINKW